MKSEASGTTVRGSQPALPSIGEGQSVAGRALVAGEATGRLLHADVGLSFWGGVHPQTGMVIDRHHPLHGSCLDGAILAIPSGRGSCTGSSVMLELVLNGHAPAGLILAEPDAILSLGVMIAEVMFGRSIPVICVDREDFARLAEVPAVRLSQGTVHFAGGSRVESVTAEPGDRAPAGAHAALHLTALDRAMLAGEHGKAAAVAMRILARIAELQGADHLIDVTQAHIDCCIYTGPASLRFARQMLDWGARVRVPTTLNAISVERRRWRELGVDAALGQPAEALGQAYLDMGAAPSFTCAPYLLETAPAFGEQIGWAESNAVAFANSILGARTQKYPDYLDACIAITGRAPRIGTHADQGRFATLRVDVDVPASIDDAFYPLLGYHIGLLCGSEIPAIAGLEACRPDRDDLKAFSAAFATTSASPMFHIVGVTPEAPTIAAALGGRDARRSFGVGGDDLLRAWRELDTGLETDIQLISLGNPHFSLSECARLAALCEGRKKAPGVTIMVTMGGAVLELARANGFLDVLDAFGVRIVTDTCWCMIEEPVFPPAVRTLMTNSGKYAHYAPGLVGRDVRFGSLADCVEAACSGRLTRRLPPWLEDLA